MTEGLNELLSKAHNLAIFSRFAAGTVETLGGSR